MRPQYVIKDWAGNLIKFINRPYLYDSFEDAESYRKAKNERLREKRAEKRAMDSLEIVIDSKNEKHGESGFHVVNTNAWSWRDDGSFCGQISDYEKRQALSKGFSRIIVHSQAPRHLTLIFGGVS